MEVSLIRDIPLLRSFHTAGRLISAVSAITLNSLVEREELEPSTPAL